MEPTRDDLVLERLRDIRGALAEVQEDVREIKQRLVFIEGGYASTSARLDRVGGDVQRVLRRLELVEEAS
jgi:hypothetical protein